MAHPSAFQPLIPEESARASLAERASSLVAEGHGLVAQCAAPLRSALVLALRAMNSYYTNKIEGQHTLPVDIERALKQDFDADAALRRKQRLAIAHLEAEAELEAAADQKLLGELYAPRQIQSIHAALYRRLPQEDRLSEEGLPVEPGEWRTQRVTAGRHVAPKVGAIAELMSTWEHGYRNLQGAELQVIGMACAHHRLAWIHPFLDGNGRTARLHSHLVLHRLGLTGGLWSPMRGLARRQDDYYARLGNADLPRRNDLDGRGQLSQEELVAFAGFFLDVCLDQVRFMRGLLQTEHFSDRLNDLLRHLSANPWPVGSEQSVIKPEVHTALHYVALTGPLERRRFLATSGLPERTARRVLASLLDFGVLKSDSRLGPVYFQIPFDSLRWLFPRLWPEAESREP
jgi:Fic family protein